MKTYEVNFIGTGSGVSSSNGPVFTTTRKKEAIQHAKRATAKHAGHPDFRGGWYEVVTNDPAVICPFVIFQSKTVERRAE